MSYFIFCPFSQSSGNTNNSMQIADTDSAMSCTFADLGKLQKIKCSEVYFILPDTGHAYVLEYSIDGKTWEPCGGHDDVIIQSPHTDNLDINARYLRVKVLKGVNGIWAWHIH